MAIVYIAHKKMMCLLQI